jgi:DNA-binding NarL/FixJ family response regulator
MLNEPPPISVALVEDDAGTRARLQQALARTPGVQLLHCAVDVAGMLAWLGEHAVDVLLVDLGLPDRSGLDVIRHCRQHAPATDVMVLTMFGDEGHMLQAFEAGARGYLLKDGSEREVARHVAQLRAGGSPMSPLIARRLIDHLAPRPVQAPPNLAAAASAGVPANGRLSARELQILHVLSRGYSYAETAKLLDIAGSTVQTHVKNIYGKLAVNSKTEAVFEARQLGLL